MSTGALILAAGASTRLGHPKQLVILECETLLDRSIRIAREAGLSPIVVVLGAFEDQVRNRCNLDQVTVVANADWEKGMGTSLSCGIAAFKNAKGIVVMTCDMPAVTSAHLQALSASGYLTASRYAGKNGVPAFLPGKLLQQLRDARGDVGARKFLRSASTIELPEGELDIDTPGDLHRLQDKFRIT